MNERVVDSTIEVYAWRNGKYSLIGHIPAGNKVQLDGRRIRTRKTDARNLWGDRHHDKVSSRVKLVGLTSKKFGSGCLAAANDVRKLTH